MNFFKFKRKKDKAQLRKEHSIEILKQHGVPYIDHLPCIETSDHINIRTADEIAKRAITCLITIQLACDMANQTDNIEKSKAFFQGMLEQFHVEDCLTPNEKAIFEQTADFQDILNMTWKYEAYWPLLWALGMVKSLNYPSDICDCNFAIQAVSSCKTYEDFIKNTSLRDIEEILDEADLIFRYDWACVNAKLNGKQAPANLNSSVVLERHCALNWLVNADQQDDWDHASPNT